MDLRPPAPDRLDWSTIRDRIDLVQVVTSLLGPPPGRRGSRGSWWTCPFHDDRNPSLYVKDGASSWRCFGCGEHGDAPALLMRINPGMGFPEAIRLLAGESIALARPRSRPMPAAPAPVPPPIDVTLRDAVLDLIAESERAIWTDDGEEALADLHRRGLEDETIIAARLGAVVGERRLRSDAKGSVWVPEGILVPWFEGDRLVLAKVRRHGDERPKYVELFRDDPVVFPGRHMIRVGLPLAVVEGEFDALLLGQIICDRASVVTLGAASNRPDDRVLRAAILASPWLIATDADAAGDKLAEAWSEVGACRRVRPASGPKDWCGMHEWGVDLRRWWREALAGVESPELFAFQELSGWRWGPSQDDPKPGIDARQSERLR